jgi:hypothetical protein
MKAGFVEVDKKVYEINGTAVHEVQKACACQDSRCLSVDDGHKYENTL